MNRTLKQILYGSAYLVVIAGIVFGAYRIWFYKTPTCFDNIKNGSEAGVDCGGSCVSCEIKNLKLDVSTAPRVFQGTADQSVLFAKVINPNPIYGVKSFSYTIGAWSILGVPIKTISGVSYLAPGETRYLVFPDLPSASNDVGRISAVEVSGVEWTTADLLPKYDLQLSGISTNVSVSGGEVDGVMSNNSPSNIPVVRLSSLLFDSKGVVLTASAALIRDIVPFTSKQFQIYFPPLGKLQGTVDRSKTQVFYEVIKG